MTTAIRADYDTFAGISEAVKTLEGFNGLVRERHRAGYKRKERLRQWFLFDGAVVLDTCGNAGRGVRTPIQGAVFREEDFRAMADCLSDDVKGLDFMHYSFGGDYASFPRAGLVCPCCGVAWGVDNFLDTYCTRELDYVKDVLECAGMTMGEFEEKLSSPEQAVTTQLRRGSKDLFDNDVVIVADDQVSISRWSFYHPECLRLKVTCEERDKFDECLEKAGFKLRLFTPVKNEYWSYPDQSMWFQVRTEVGEFKAGWRKRVISVEFDEKLGVLTDDDVTKNNGLVHAWGYDKFTEYMGELRRRMRGDDSCRKE